MRSPLLLALLLALCAAQTPTESVSASPTETASPSASPSASTLAISCGTCAGTSSGPCQDTNHQCYEFASKNTCPANTRKCIPDRPSALLLGLASTLVTYIFTAAGAAGVFVFDTHGNRRKTELAMAVATGLMLAAVIELLADANRSTAESSLPLSLHWVPPVVGVLVACTSLWAIDKWLQKSVAEATPATPLLPHSHPHPVCVEGFRPASPRLGPHVPHTSSSDEKELQLMPSAGVSPVDSGGSVESSDVMIVRNEAQEARTGILPPAEPPVGPTQAEVRKAKLLVFALAVQHLPEALACGVAMASAVDPVSGGDAEMAVALSLTLAIALQDVPEGMTAAFVLRNLGMSKWKAFCLGQATGLIEPIGGLIGAGAVLLVEALLPYALSYAGAAMLFVIVRDMIPDVMANEETRMTNTMVVMLAYAAMVLFDSSVTAAFA